MKASPDLARAIVESATDYGIITFDRAGIITSWNCGAERLMGWSSAEAVGHYAGLFFTDEDRARGAPEHEMALAERNGRAADERWHLKKDGTRFFGYGEMMPLQTQDGGYVKILRDQTKGYRTARALRRSEEELRVVTDALPILISLVDRDGVYRFMNQYYEIWMGRPREELVGCHLREVIGEESYQQRLPQVERALAGEHVTFEGPLGHRTGEKRPASIQYIPRTAADGSVDGFFVLVTDISERKRAEDALRTSYGRLECLAEAIEEMSSARSPKELVEIMGRAAQKVAGVDGVTLSLREGEHVYHAAESACEPLWAGKRFPIQNCLSGWCILNQQTAVVPDVLSDERAPREVYEPTFIRAAVVVPLAGFDAGGAAGNYWRQRHEPAPDEVAALQTIARAAGSVLNRISAEDALRTLNQDLESQVQARTADRNRMWELSSDVMLVADFAARVEAVNPAWTTLFGWSEAELIGRDFTSLIHPDDRAETLNEVAKLGQGLRTLRFENRYRHKDGSYRWLSWTAVPDVAHIHAVGRDIQAEKEAAEALRKAEEQLRQSQKMEAIGQLTGGIAHDFNNMLTGVIGSLDLVQRYITSGRLDRIGRYIDAATTSAQRAAALTARLLAFGRRQSLDLQPTDVNKLVSDMEDLLTRTLGEQITLETRLEAGLWPATTDANQLESALLNLCINARDAMPDGGKLTIETTNTQLDQHYAREHADVVAGEYIAISVSDTGIGMSAETISRIFEPFFTTKPAGQGTGLGLSMIYGFAQQSGGHVRVDSKPGEGSTFRLYVPRHHGAAEAGSGPAGVVPTGAGETVMVVEDDASVRMIVLDVLQELGYRGIEASDAREAIPILESGARIDLLVTDVGLPGMNGRQLAEVARQSRPELRILFVTGYAENAAVRGGFLGQGMEMLTKPFAIDTLATKLRDILGRTDRNDISLPAPGSAS
jgi:PAS domain S-box-containing protein